ncbi:hypothetical protein KFE96_04990 [Kordiimonas sp. SCSIO 12603]|uniref:hypothetical protein n=1 Tax=Kordiimonas sp. SCSIO 12603 TaxID=2829596 RepID=UPI0021045A2F|nr:hypothetical protein [Kordiimonas sp. SCSIO 12603]UTW59662.1 hypothetical protein KFE96_04990 [Kordiimonas sp. SCSIO 12603]
MDTKTDQNEKHSWGDIETVIDSVLKVLLSIAILIFVFYSTWFYFTSNGSLLSKSASDWGSFGDFFGGIFNPLISSVMLYILFQSFKTQRQELRSVSSEMKASVKLNALQSLHQITSEELRINKQELIQYQKNLEQLGNPPIKSLKHLQKRNTVNKKINSLGMARLVLEKKQERIVNDINKYIAP